MSACANGHSVPEGQPFCGTCGSPATAEPETHEPTDARGGSEGLDRGEPAESGWWASLARHERQGLLVAAGLVALLVVGVGALIATGDEGSDGAGGESAAGEPSTTTVAYGPEDYCFEDLAGILDDATATGGGVQDAYGQIMRVYGMEDPRTFALRQVLLDFNSDQVRVGYDNANANASGAIMDWCAVNADDPAYPYSG